MLFADDFVGVSDSEEHLQKLIDVIHAYCCKWRLKANVSRSAVMFFLLGMLLRLEVGRGTFLNTHIWASTFSVMGHGMCL